ncbi:YggT family protein [Magnetococcales bacterium HHB-1]
MGIMHSIGTLLTFLLEIYSWLILLRVLLSWVNPDPYNPIVQFLYRATEPVMRPLREKIPSFGGMDFSPIIALLGIMLLKRLVFTLFMSSASGLEAINILFADFLHIIYIMLTLYLLILLVRAGMGIYSWFIFRQRRISKLNPNHPFFFFIFTVTEPVVRPVRNVLPTISGMDISPIAVIFLLIFLLQIIQGIIFTLQPQRFYGG